MRNGHIKQQPFWPGLLSAFLLRWQSILMEKSTKTQSDTDRKSHEYSCSEPLPPLYIQQMRDSASWRRRSLTRRLARRLLRRPS